MRFFPYLLASVAAVTCHAHPSEHHDHKLIDPSITHAAHDVRIEVTDGPNPWTEQPFLNDPRDFQFAVISDNTGGMRPGIIEIAVDKLNLLQPEFVMSVGDLIEGYTEDIDRLNFEWDEFNEKIDPLEMKFFYVPGNHDMTNEVMAKLWEERFGRAYYHFVYNDVLFLCLNTEDTKKENISPAQIEWIEEVLEAHKDVRWTMVFMHKPLWQYEMNYAEKGSDQSTGWLSVEAMLKERQHTVLCGHFHRYAHYEKNNSDYIILSTTGGGSQLRGPEYGEIDHLTWITMTDEGPVLSNIAIQGILPKDFAKPEAGRFIYDTLRVLKVAIAPHYTNEGTLPSNYETEIFVKNGGTSDVTLSFEIPEITGLEITATQTNIEVQAGTTTTLPLSIQSSSGKDLLLPSPIEFPYTISAKLEKEVSVEFVEQVSLITAPLIATKGNINWIELNAPTHISGNEQSWHGPEDGSFKFKAETKDAHLEIQIVAHDDTLLPPEGVEDAWIGDGLELRVSPIQDPLRSIETAKFWQDQNKNYFAMYLVPDTLTRSYSYNYGTQIPEGITTACSTSETGDGYTAMVSIPISVLDKFAGGTAEKIRISIGQNDRDTQSEQPSQIWWPEDWRSAQMRPGSGTFSLKARH